MSIRNLNWYNLQATRRYPIDDTANGESSDNQSLPNDIIVDAHIRFPNSLGNFAYVQGVTISAGIATVLIGVSESFNSEGATIGAVSAPQPVMPGVHYPIASTTGGVAGWLVFGAGAQTSFSGRFLAPKNSLIAARCARGYRPLPIVDIGKKSLSTALSGIVKIVGESPVEIITRSVSIEDQNVNAFVFRLNQSDNTLRYNPLSYFLGPCGQRPESGTCLKEPIETINGVAPDCAGNIAVEFENLSAVNFGDCGGFDILTPLTLAQICDGSNYKPPVFYKDLCCPAEVETVADRDALPLNSLKVGAIVKTLLPSAKYWIVKTISESGATWEETTEIDAICGWPDPTTAIPTVVLDISAVQDYPTLAIPVCVDFCSCGLSPIFDVRRGVFQIERTTAPFGCAPCGEAQIETENSDPRQLANKNTYATVDSSGLNLATLKNSASDWAYGKKITAQFKISSAGLDRNGGVIINYRHERNNAAPQIKYLAAVLDISRGQLRLLRYTNDSFVVEAQESLNVKTNVWYNVAVTTVFNGNNIGLIVSAAETINPENGVTISTNLSLEQYGSPIGAAGLYANRSFTYFNKLTITD